MSDKPVAWFYERPNETGKFMCGDAEAMKGIEKNGWVTTPLYTKTQLDEMLHQLQAENDALRKTVDSLFAGLDSSLALNKAQAERQDK